MLNPVSIPPVIIATLVFYVGFYHSLIYFRIRDRRENLSFAFSCFVVGAYALSCVGLYNMESPESAVFWQRIQVFILSMLAVAVLLFVSDYTGKKKRIIDYVFIIYFPVSGFLAPLFGGELLWMDAWAVKDIILPFGIHVTYNEMAPGILVNLLSFVGIVYSIYIIVSCVNYYRSGDKKRGLLLLLALLFCVIGLCNDICVNNRFYDFIYLIEYSYIGVVMLFTFNLTDSAITVSRIREKLLKSEKKYRAIFDSSINAIATVDTATGEIIDCNEASVKLFYKDGGDLTGVKPHEISPKYQPGGELSFDLAQKHINDALKDGRKVFEWYHKRDDGNVFPVIISLNPVRMNDRDMVMAVLSDITEIKKVEEEKEKLIRELRDALENIKTLSGLLPICSRCKKIKDDKGYWKNLEAYIEEHSSASFSHSICNQCSDELYSHEQWYIDMKRDKEN